MEKNGEVNLSINEKLAMIQATLKVPKSEYNKHGQFNYRSCEGILEALKPLCELAKTVLTIEDKVELIGDRYYIKATVTLTNLCEPFDSIYLSAYAREVDQRKGMDESQITGSTSSYARKYALNGMFCIDDTKDADTMNNSQNQGNNQSNSRNRQSTGQNNNGNQPPKRITKAQQNLIVKFAADAGADIRQALNYFNIKSVEEMTKEQFERLLAKYKKAISSASEANLEES